MPLIGYIAPNKKMANMAKRVFDKHGVDVAIEVGYIEAGLKKAEILMEQGIKVIISRGGTALCIRKNLDVPVIEIPITVADISKSLVKASRLGSKFIIIGFFNLLEGLENLNPLLNVELKQVYIKNEEEAYNEILKAKEEQIEVIIGGAVQHKMAKNMGIKSVFLETGPLAIYHAYCEAETVLKTLSKEQQKSKEIRAIFDYARDGFLAINKESIVTLINSTAALTMNCSVETAVGKSLDDVAPRLLDLKDVLKHGKECIQDIKNIGQMNIIYNRIPIIVNGEIVGAVAIFQDISVLQETESKIRREFYTKGLYAKYTFQNIDGVSNEINIARNFAEKFSKTKSTVLIKGETGTGKEIFAQSIHNASTRNTGPFVAVNCASLPENLLESELFGYVEGAFTGAVKKGKPGLFELAHKGTIFLDEISEIPFTLQGRLLRVLQEKSVMRLGDDKIIPIDVRIIAATNKDLVEAVRKEKFREDLFFRLNILRLDLPALRDRPEDVEILANIFLKEYNTMEEAVVLSKTALDSLKNYEWPGNIRELRNLIERISIISTSEIAVDSLIGLFIDENRRIFNKDPEEHSDSKGSTTYVPIDQGRPTKEKICKVLRATQNNKGKAAEMLGVNRSTLWRWLKEIDEK